MALWQPSLRLRPQDFGALWLPMDRIGISFEYFHPLFLALLDLALGTEVAEWAI